MTTIIIPNYNGLSYLDACLKSVFADIQDNDNITDVIVVDDASTDESVAFIATQYPAARLIRLTENSGFCHAVNTGIRATESEFVILLNNDTTVQPGFCTALLAAIEEDEAIFSAAALMLQMENPALIDNAGDFYTALGWAYARGKDRRQAKDRASVTDRASAMDSPLPSLDSVKNNNRYHKPRPIFSSCAGAAIYRRSVLLELGLFDAAHYAYLEDVDIGYAARLHGYKNRLCPAAMVLHIGSATFSGTATPADVAAPARAVSPSSRHNPHKCELAAKNSIYIIHKNMPLLQIIWNLPFLLIGFFIKFIFFSFKGMGHVYLRGLGRGLKLSCSPSGHGRKNPFRWRRLKYYLIVQWELYLNIFRAMFPYW